MFRADPNILNSQRSSLSSIAQLDMTRHEQPSQQQENIFVRIERKFVLTSFGEIISVVISLLLGIEVAPKQLLKNDFLDFNLTLAMI